MFNFWYGVSLKSYLELGANDPRSSQCARGDSQSINLSMRTITYMCIITREDIITRINRKVYFSLQPKFMHGLNEYIEENDFKLP